MDQISRRLDVEENLRRASIRLPRVLAGGKQATHANSESTSRGRESLRVRRACCSPQGLDNCLENVFESTPSPATTVALNTPPTPCDHTTGQRIFPVPNFVEEKTINQLIKSLENSPDCTLRRATPPTNRGDEAPPRQLRSGMKYKPILSCSNKRKRGAASPEQRQLRSGKRYCRISSSSHNNK